jgi:3-oxoacid CoA-transferase subunit A
LEGRSVRQSRLSQIGSEFQPDGGDMRARDVAEVEHLVGAGELESDRVHTPSVFVQRLILASQNEKRIEQRIVRKEVG